MPALASILAGLLTRSGALLGPLGWLVHPYTLVAIGLAVSHGYAWREGRAFQARANEMAMVTLNTKLEELATSYATREEAEAVRIRDAVTLALSSLADGDAPGAEKCRLSQALTAQIREIAR